MPHDGLQRRTCPAVVQSVGILGTGATLVQATSPQRCSTAPSRTDVVHHVQLVLYHVRIRPYLLIGIAWQQVGPFARKETCRVAYLVLARRPAGLVAVGTAYFRKEFLAAHHSFVVYIACGRHGQTTVPHHQVDVVLIADFYWQVLRCQIIIDVIGYVVRKPFGMLLGSRYLGNVCRKSGLNVRILRSIRSIRTCRIQIMETPVTAGHVRNVPEGIGSGSILQGPATQGIRIAVRILRTVTSLSRVGILSRPLTVGKNVRVQTVGQKAVLFLPGILGFQVSIADGIQQTGSVYTDGRFQTHFVLTHVISPVGHIDRTFRNRHFRIAQTVSLPVGKLITESIGILVPRDADLRLVNRCLEGSHCLRLRHTGQPGHIGIGRRIVDNKQIAVSYLVGVERTVVLTLAMTVAGMAVHAGSTDIERSQAVTHPFVVRVERLFKQLFSPFEFLKEVFFHNSRRLLKCCCGLQERSSQFSPCIIPFGQFRGSSVRRRDSRSVVLAGGQAQAQRSHQVKIVTFHFFLRY